MYFPEIISLLWQGYTFEVLLDKGEIMKARWRKDAKITILPKSSFGQEVYDWLEGYFQGKNKSHTFSLRLKLSPFLENVYRALNKIPYGKTVTYGELGLMAGYTHAGRAVGQAMAKNPIPVFIPCHRVVACSSLGGYTPDPFLKKALLRLEQFYAT
ncbi:MAG: methylated-DNA--[protein]-cysteine S-methyltransferase [Leptospiraceae bacterium]|nr:methylated-DNA--[protein]-cysteine S-methyltransferase [Leptospiraceae bacterium]MDW8307548.1 methylated-DNA--[protein]-cysteine S-methyltransferase [Leptospiraceae bacterium]